MGAVLFTIQNFYDQTSELVGIKSGILLNEYRINKILKENFHDGFLDNIEPNHLVRLRSEEIEAMIKYIRIRIGNISPNPKVNYYRILAKYFKSVEYFKILNQYLNYAIRQSILGLELTHTSLRKEISKNKGLNEELVDALTFAIMERVDEGITFPPSYNLDGATPLQSLFELEVFPLTDNTFIDQKFIDYLAVNGNEIEEVHWRNFERFVAEYFQRQGLKVVLGSGQSDGGVDIRVFNETNNKDPFILIQCKRYKAQNKVSIETVKAFHSDVEYENAKLGLIATTSRIATGGKKVVDARNYKISFAEKEKIKKWATTMWNK
jgi:HJR/Mrr/RecB family endonuclease